MGICLDVGGVIAPRTWRLGQVLCKAPSDCSARHGVGAGRLFVWHTAPQEGGEVVGVGGGDGIPLPVASTCPHGVLGSVSLPLWVDPLRVVGTGGRGIEDIYKDSEGEGEGKVICNAQHKACIVSQAVCPSTSN